MTSGFFRIGPGVEADFDADEAQAVALVVAQVAGLVQAEAAAAGLPVEAELLDGRPRPSGVAEDEHAAGGDITDAYLAELTGLDAVPPPRPQDPALARLFPDGYADDPEAAAELRRLTHSSLRALKIDNAATVLDGLPLGGGRVRLDADGSRAWMLALNDARLVLGTRLDLTDDTDLVAELDEAVATDPTGPRVLAISLYQFLSFLLETLINAMDR